MAAQPTAPSAAAIASVRAVPGSSIDQALSAAIKKRSKRLHKPKILKILGEGKPAYEMKQLEKEKGRKIDEKHAQYHLSFGMMLGIFVSVR